MNIIFILKTSLMAVFISDDTTLYFPEQFFGDI